MKNKKNNIYLIIFIIIILIIILFKEQKKIETFAICGQKNLNRIDIWRNVKNMYGEKEALKIFPKSFILPNDLEELKRDKNEQYILKKIWSSARKGVELYNNKEKIIKDHKKFDLAQVYIKNPLLINGRKFNIRIYMVKYCGLGNFLYLHGYNGYTENKFDYNSLDRTKKINQAYPKDTIYKKYKLPRTTIDLEKYLKKDFRIIMNLLSQKIKKVLKSSPNLCCTEDNGNYNIYGLDVELLDNLEPMIIEINSTPTLKFNIEWKKNLIKKMKNDIKNKNFNNNWIKI